MSRFLVSLLALGSFAPTVGSAPKVKDKPPHVFAIVGEWVVESRTLGGRVLAQPEVRTRLVFRTDGTYTFVVNGQDLDPDGHKFKLDTKAGLAEIDFVPRDRPAFLGVFKIEKDTLTLCTTPAGESRPTAFESAAGSKSTLYVFKRATME